ncbi:MAG: amidohydrolase family protein, partial [Candidatus Ranarchaeia archaeon]
MKSKIGIEVVDSHAHFITFDTMTRWLNRGVSLDRLKQRIQNQTDMGSSFEIPTERWDTGKMWVDELDKYGITAIGMMIGLEEREEFVETRKRFPGRFLGYANVDPAQPDAIERVRKAGEHNFQGIKLYPSQWNFPIYDPRVYPILEEVKKQNL